MPEAVYPINLKQQKNAADKHWKSLSPLSFGSFFLQCKTTVLSALSCQWNGGLSSYIF
nr:MAG TPA: hypothetical protein [Bacteriophage sp.]